MIRFGTDGWRALVAEEFTFPNVRAVVQAIASFLKNHPAPGRLKTVVVGYDTRPLGDRFAEAASEVLAGNGFPVLITQTPMPTPAVSLSIRKLRLSGGVLITASHNPFTYNGVKFRPFYAGGAEPEMTQWIEGRLFREPVKAIPFSRGLKERRIRRIDLSLGYLDFLRGYVDWRMFKKSSFRVAYDSMHGAGGDLLRRLLEPTPIEVIPVRQPGEWIPSRHRPEPVQEELTQLCQAVQKFRCDLGLATDGDADRGGIVDPKGNFVTSQETMALLLWHLLEDRGWRGKVATTVAGTNLLEAMADRFGVAFTRTPVGFKHIAKLMRSENLLFGGEESGGYGFRGFVPERDGLLAGLMILEMIAMRGKNLIQILSDLRDRFGHWHSARGDLVLTRPLPAQRLQRWASLGGKLPLPSRFRLKEIQTTDGAKLIFADHSWLLMRPSGTEPLLRIYAEAKNPRAVAQMIQAAQKVGRGMLRG